MDKKIRNYFECQYPGCHLETDRGFEHKERLYCLSCYKKIKKEEKDGKGKDEKSSIG